MLLPPLGFSRPNCRILVRHLFAICNLEHSVPAASQKSGHSSQQKTFSCSLG
jgi:hypothetical protein